MTATNPIFVSKKVAATLMGISIGTLDRLRRQRFITAVRIGRRVMFKREQLEKFTGARFRPELETEGRLVM